jgi:Uma2 family endonuclease
VGAWLLKHAPKEAGLEPDDCYIIGDLDKPVPDLAVEVVWTSGGIGKLEVYRRLGVGEVWFWKDDAITFHVLVGDTYEQRETSACVPQFDRQLAYEMLELPSLSDVKRALRERLG